MNLKYTQISKKNRAQNDRMNKLAINLKQKVDSEDLSNQIQQLKMRMDTKNDELNTKSDQIVRQLSNVQRQVETEIDTKQELADIKSQLQPLSSKISAHSAFIQVAKRQNARIRTDERTMLSP